MKNSISVTLFDNNTSSIKQLSVSKRKMLFLGMIAALSFIVMCFFIVDYFTLKTSISETIVFENNISSQVDEISGYEKQIKIFSKEILSLRSTLDELNKIEKEIRVVANLDQSATKENLFGIGGSNSDETGFLASGNEYSQSVIDIDDLDAQLIKNKNSMIEKPDTVLNFINNKKNLLTSIPAICPVTGIYISCQENLDRFPANQQQSDKKTDKGINIITHAETPIISTADGIITYSGNKGIMGNVIVVDHGYGMITRYSYLSKMIKEQGAIVERGDVIAFSGNSINTNSSHLYYEVFLNGLQVNPLSYIVN